MRRLVVSVCPREPGIAVLRVERRGPRERLDARAIATHLEAIVARRGLAECVGIERGCAGGCAGPGPNVTVRFYRMPGEGERADHVSIGWKTYVASIETLDCLARIVEENLATDRGVTATRARRGRRRAGR